MISPRKLITVLLSACLAACAAPAPGPRCPDKRIPRFSGHPFVPYICRKDPTAPKPGSGKSLLTATIQPVVVDASSTKISAATGNWEGWAMYGNARFQVTISIQQGQNVTLKLAATEYISHHVNKLQADLAASAKHPGLYTGKIGDLALPRSPLKATAWLGEAPAPQSQGLDHSFVLSYNSLAALHEFRFKFDGPDKIWYVYSYRQAGQPPIQTSGSLTRTNREAF
jgi:hypothetical protein